MRSVRLVVKGKDVVATSRLALPWMCDSPQTGRARRKHPYIRGANKKNQSDPRWSDLGELSLTMLVNLVSSWLYLQMVVTEVISSDNLYCCLLSECEALRTCRFRSLRSQHYEEHLWKCSLQKHEYKRGYRVIDRQHLSGPTCFAKRFVA